MLPLQNFKDYIGQNALFTANDKILLAVSGGRDSVLMVHLFKLSGYNFGIAHCNFNLRGEESIRDEHFVKMLAATLDVPFYVTHFETKAYATAHKVSIQMAARDLRYQWFEEIRSKEGYACIALAQHQDDAIETVLLNLTRGTGIAGLHGILPKRGHLIRPLLFLSRTEINELMEGEKLDYVEDSSNLSTNYARNKIRLKVLPQLKEINGNLEVTFQHNIQRFADTELVLQKVVADLSRNLLIQKQDGIYLSIAEVKGLSPQKLLLFEVLKPYGFSEHLVADVLQALDKQSGISFFSSSHQLTLDREDLILKVLKDKDAVARQHLLIHAKEGGTLLPEGELNMLNVTKSIFDRDYGFKNDPFEAYLDAEKLIYPLVLRSKQTGDKFKPIGMSSFKKLSDLFIDEKIPVTRKDDIPVLVNGNGEIIWVVGLRADNRYKLGPGTKNVTILTFRNLHITNS
ncbi:tRNA lysidine(34) synthetase TilS [Pedobacter caeni]|uniref:tRNA(Ile)-lysidine synthase n=1 Tax=Pedobacter caeni TaxID=288992 RepID=A0A1M5DVW1_9SPHI|nr:tRNA lysidine(34) synthetase TilS [Pedobacter caeni]SHF71133.1 tRNA(Ile)-lysidine synthase [Pedobacter caeni]